MITFILVVLIIGMALRIAGFAIKATWGLTKLILGVFFIPCVLIGLVLFGLIKIVIPVLIILGIITLVKRMSATA